MKNYVCLSIIVVGMAMYRSKSWMMLPYLVSPITIFAHPCTTSLCETKKFNSSLSCKKKKNLPCHASFLKDYPKNLFLKDENSEKWSPMCVYQESEPYLQPTKY